MSGNQTSYPRLSMGEIPFGYDETYFSRTDEQGIIRAGNDIFQRISGYPWAELIGAPHCKIRHPDMPKGMFHLFWKRLKAGKPISGYVKNLAADGRYFWAYIAVFPIPGGYLGIGLKPASELHARAQAQYVDLLKLENEQGVSAKESGELIEIRLKQQGYNGLANYMATTFAAELTEHNKKLGLRADPRGLKFTEVTKVVQEAISHTNLLCETFKAIEAVPHNMRILASRLETAGGPIAAISSNYGSISKKISEWVNQFILGEKSAFSNLRDAVDHSRMLSAAARVNERALFQIKSGQDEPSNSIIGEKELEILEQVSQQYNEEANNYLRVVEREALVFGRAVGEMKRMIAGLSTTRMMCKIESAQLPEKNESLEAIIDQLDSFQTQLEERLESISAITRTVLSLARSLENNQNSVVNKGTTSHAGAA